MTTSKTTPLDNAKAKIPTAKQEVTKTKVTATKQETSKEKVSTTKKEVIENKTSQSSFGNIKSFTKLYYSYYIRSFDAIFLTFVFPLLMLFMLGAVMPAQTLLPGLWLLPGITTAFFFLPKSLVHWRSSSLIKRIGITPIKPWEFIMSIFLVNLAIATAGFLMMIGVSAIINEVVPFFIAMPEDLTAGANPEGSMATGAFVWSKVDWLNTIFGFFNVMILSLATAFAIGMFAKSEGQAFGIGMTLYFVISFLGGVFFDLILINGIMPLKYTSMGLPWAWTTKLYIASACGDTMFYAFDSSVNNWVGQDIYDTLGMSKEVLLGVGYGMGVAFSALLFGFTAKFSTFGKIK